jgi:hypothetical protein
MPETKTLDWKDPDTGKKFKIKYQGDVPPTDAAIRKMTGAGAVKVHEYRHPDDGKTYRVKYTGEVPPSGDDIIKAAKPVRAMNSAKATGRRAATVAGGLLKGLSSGGYSNMPPMETDKTGRVLAPVVRASPPGGRDALQIITAPGLNPVGRAISTVSNAPRNFAQGATAPGLDRFDSLVAAGQKADGATMARALFTDVPGNVKAGVRAVVHDSGAQEIGKRVPELAPETLEGMLYNLATSAGSDPLNLIGASAPELTGAALRIANKTAKGRKLVAAAGAARGMAEPGEVTNAVNRSGNVPGVRASLPEGSTVRPIKGGAMGRNPSPDAMAARGRIEEVVNPGGGRPPKPIPARPAKEPLPHVLLGGKEPTLLPSEKSALAVQKLQTAAKSLRTSAPDAKSAGTAGHLPRPSLGVSRTPFPQVKSIKDAAKVAGDIYGETDSLMRGLSYGGDLSATLRQGAVLGVTRPVQASRAFVNQVRAFVDPAAFDGQMKQVAARPTAQLHQDMGLYVPDAKNAGRDFMKREEAFTSKLAERLPVVKQVVGAGDRAMTAYLTRMRADIFDSTMAAWEKEGIKPDTHPEEYKALAEWINTATGRGNLGKLEGHAETLSKVFGSPRLQASRLAVINPLTYAKMPAKTRQLAIRDTLSFVGANAALLGLAKIYGDSHPESGVKVNFDPRSGDIGGVRIGNTKVDFTAGLSPWVKMLSQVSTGTKVDKNGKETPVDRPATLLKFGEGRLAPLPSLVIDAMRGTTFNGEKFDPASDTAKRFIPLFIQDLKAVMEEHGAVQGGVLGALAGSGASVQTYPPKDAKKPATAGEYGDMVLHGRANLEKERKH